MQILAARKRIPGTRPLFEYRVLVPFDQIPVERHTLIHYRSDFGFSGCHYARLTEVIAPTAFLRMTPSPAKHDLGLDILTVAKRIEALIVRALYPEMTAERIPIVFCANAEHDDRQTHIDVRDLVDSYRQFAQGTELPSTEAFGLAPEAGAA